MIKRPTSSDHLTDLLSRNVPFMFRYTNKNIPFVIKYSTSPAPESKEEYAQYGNTGWLQYVSFTHAGPIFHPTGDLYYVANMKNSRGQLPLYVAARFSSIQHLDLLFSANANPNGNPDTPDSEKPISGLFDSIRDTKKLTKCGPLLEKDDYDLLEKKINLFVSKGLSPSEMKRIGFIFPTKKTIDELLMKSWCDQYCRN